MGLSPGLTVTGPCVPTRSTLGSEARSFAEVRLLRQSRSLSIADRRSCGVFAAMATGGALPLYPVLATLDSCGRSEARRTRSSFRRSISPLASRTALAQETAEASHSGTVLTRVMLAVRVSAREPGRHAEGEARSDEQVAYPATRPPAIRRRLCRRGYRWTLA